MTRRTAHSVLATLLLLAWHGLALAEMRLNLQDAKTQLGHQVHDLHTIVLIICVVIFIGVFGVMFYAIWKHRKSVGHQAAHFHENTTVEVLWTVIPAFVLLGMMFPATKTLLAQRDTSAPDLTVKVTGYQWKWQYEYLDEGISIYSNLSTPRAQIEGGEAKGEHYLLEVDNPMVVPVGKKVRVLTTAGDVLHAWYVPALAVKQDAIPGFVRDTWFKAEEPGTFRGQCAELCGKEHGYMPIVVEAVTEDKYREWVAKHKASAPQAAAGSAPSPATLYFDSGKADLPADAATALEGLTAYLKEHKDAKVNVSGYHDKTGGAAVNYEVAKNRAKAVKAALVAAGMSDAQVVLDKPQETLGGADPKEARRVEVKLAGGESPAGAPAQAAAADGRGTYDGLCGACHGAGLAGAPKTGDKGQWASRIAQGQATLYEHAVKGVRTMPAKGGNPALSDDQVKAAVDYMVAQSK